MAQTVPLANYLFTRLHQLGVGSLHGVPGDFNLEALDYVEDAGLTWIGDANELNAGYAADGYARIKGIGALITTFGVGELSAINAIAGSYAEKVPVIHIAGSPSTASQRDGMILHHTLGNGDFRVFSDIYARVTVAQANLTDPAKAPSMIDEVLRQCLIKSRPVYIELPTDMVHKPVDASNLSTPIKTSLPPNNADIQSEVVSKLLERIYAARQPLLLVDGGVGRHQNEPIVRALVKRSGLPTFVSPMGKGLIDETLPNFCGIYAGSGSYPPQREFVEESDLVISLGALKSDFNTAGFTYRLSILKTVELDNDHISIGYARYDAFMGGVVDQLTAELDVARLIRDIPPSLKTRTQSPGDDTEHITQAWLWPRLSTWLRPNDILVTETGTSYLGVWDTALPPSVTVLSQTLWGSIGAALPMAQGAALAAREQAANEQGTPRRVILFEGDGSAQLTAQALGTMLRHKLDIVVLLINNDGYTIERWVHGMDAGYNEIAPWRYSELPSAMGASRENCTVRQVRTRGELEAMWAEEGVVSPKGMQFVEMFMDKYDAPESLKLVCEAAAKTNAG